MQQNYNNSSVQFQTHRVPCKMFKVLFGQFLVFVTSDRNTELILLSMQSVKILF